MIQQDVADLVGLSRSTISELVSDMERAGLAYRVTCPENRRKVRVFLTEAGMDIAGQIQALYAEYLSECLSGFTQEEIRLLESLMKKIK